MNNSNQWRVIPMDIHGWSIHDAEDNQIVKDIYDQEVAEQIALEHNSHGPLVSAARKFVTAYEGEKAVRLGNGQARLSLDEFRAALALADKDS